MSCNSHSHSHSHGHDHGDDHVPPPDTYESQSLHNRIHHDQIRTLNESQRDAGRDIFKSWENRLDTTKVSKVQDSILANGFFFLFIFQYHFYFYFFFKK